VQLTASVTLLWIITLTHPASKRELLPELFDRRQAWKLLFLGLPGLWEPGFGYMFCMLGLARTSASNATLIGAIEPAIVISIAWIFLGELVGFYLLWISTLNIIGAVLTVGFDSNLNASSLIGDLLVVAGTVCAAVYAVLSRRGVQQLSALPLTAIQQSFRWILVLGICWLASGESTLFNFAGSQAILGLAIASGIIQRRALLDLPCRAENYFGKYCCTIFNADSGVWDGRCLCVFGRKVDFDAGLWDEFDFDSSFFNC